MNNGKASNIIQNESIYNENGSLLINYTEKFIYHISGKRSAFISRTLKLVRVLEGEATWRVGNKIFDVKKNSLMIFNNNTMRLVMKIPTQTVRIEHIEFPPTVLSGEYNVLDVFFADENTDCVIDLNEANGNEILKCYEEIKNEIINPGLLYRDCIKGKLISLLVQINRFYDRKGIAIKKERSEVLRIVTSYIWDNISKDITVEELSEIAHMSRSHFSAIFKKFFGISVVTYIRQCRVLNVIQLIRWNDMNILDAAFQSGFTSSSGFYKTFNGIMGMSPRDYLKTNN